MRLTCAPPSNMIRITRISLVISLVLLSTLASCNESEESLSSPENLILEDPVENKPASNMNSNDTDSQPLVPDCPTELSLDDAEDADYSGGVQMVNSTQVSELLDPVVKSGNNENNSSRCIVLLFYYPWCIFSAKAAPHFNALGRIYPQLEVMALDAYAHNGINMRFGLVGVPSILFFHNSKLVAKFNDSDPSIEGLVSFITRVTGIKPSVDVKLLPQDWEGPVPTTPISRMDYVLLICWIFLFLCSCHWFFRTQTFAKITEYLRSNWREARDADHQHQD